jgi:hypothetical protein
MNGCRLASEEVALMVHAFGDEGRRQAVRRLAARVRRLEEVAAAARDLTSWDWFHLLKDYGTEAGDVVECAHKLIDVLQAVLSNGTPTEGT